MSCKVQGHTGSNYQRNPLISPLLDFHGRFLKTADNLRQEGKFAEVCKRIGYIVAAPFAYLALAFLALAGIIFNPIWKNKHVKKVEVIEKEKFEGIPSEMIQALGGVEKVRNLPKIVNWNGSNDILPFPIMFSEHKDGPILIFTTRKAMPYYDLYPNSYYIMFPIEAIQWQDKTETWRIKNPKESELGLRCSIPIKKGSLEEKYMIERIARLVKGEPVGKFKQYTNKNTSAPVFSKPDNKDEFRPADSYLKGEELEQYMGLNTVFYESEVPNGVPTSVELNKKEGNLLRPQ
jgi:hypothetical protein